MDSTTQIFDILSGFGPIGLFLFLFFMGKIRREGEIQEKDERIEKLESTIGQYIDHYQKEVLPALIEVTRVSGEVLAFLNKQRD